MKFKDYLNAVLKDKEMKKLWDEYDEQEESLLTEAKVDIDNFINKFGEDTYNNFLKAKDRLKNKGQSVDLTYYTKNVDKKELDDLLLSLYDDKKGAQKKRVMYKNYEDLLNVVLANSNEEEKARIVEENELTKERGWEEYILLLANMLPELSENGCFLSLSVMDSYLLFKANNLDKTDNKLLRNQKAKDVLFNDALKLRIENIWLSICLEEKKQKTYDILNKYLKAPLEIIADHHSHKGVEYNYVIVSDNGIDDNAETFFYIDRGVLECKEVDEEGMEDLKRYLLIEVISKMGI